MKILKDLFTGDEICSDSYPIVEVDDIVYEIQAKSITKTDSGDYNIGANPSQGGGEGGDDAAPEEGVDSTTVTVINIVDAHRLQPTQFDKKAYMGYIKNYMKNLLTKLKENNPSRVDAFQKAAQTFVKKVIDNFSNYDAFYIGETDYEISGMVLLMFYKEIGRAHV